MFFSVKDDKRNNPRKNQRECRGKSENSIPLFAGKKNVLNDLEPLGAGEGYDQPQGGDNGDDDIEPARRLRLLAIFDGQEIVAAGAQFVFHVVEQLVQAQMLAPHIVHGAGLHLVGNTSEAEFMHEMQKIAAQLDETLAEGFVAVFGAPQTHRAGDA